MEKNLIFFENFLKVSSLKTVIFLLLLLAIVGIINILPKKTFKFSAKVMIGTLAGLILGLVIQFVANFPQNPMEVKFIAETTLWYSLLGGGFISFIKMLVIPLVMVSIIHVIINMKEDTNIGALVRRSLTVILVMVAISAVVGFGLATFFEIGKGVTVSNGTREAREVANIVNILKGLIPDNPVKVMVNMNVVALVIFSAMVGMGAKRMSKKYMDVVQPFFGLINALQKIIMSMAMSIIKWMPVAVVPLLANTIAQRGLSALVEVGKFIILLYVGTIIMFIIQMIAVSFFGLNPFTYVKKSSSLIFLAFTSRSSVGCLPVTITTMTKKLGVNETTANFVGSFGTTAGMQGCAGLFPAMAIVFVTNMSGHPVDLTLFIMSIIVITIGSLGIAGIPGAATMAASIGLSGTGMAASFPMLSSILAIDPIIDMPRTMLNVIGSVTNALMVDRSLNQLDKDTYNNMNIVEDEEDKNSL